MTIAITVITLAAAGTLVGAITIFIDER